MVGWVPGRRESFGPAQGRAAEAEESLEELRELAVSAGARGTAVEEVARALIAAGEIKLHRAQEILAKLVAAGGPSAEAT